MDLARSGSRYADRPSASGAMRGRSRRYRRGRNRQRLACHRSQSQEDAVQTVWRHITHGQGDSGQSTRETAQSGGLDQTAVKTEQMVVQKSEEGPAKSDPDQTHADLPGTAENLDTECGDVCPASEAHVYLLQTV